jgi:hypothetical protein
MKEQNVSPVMDSSKFVKRLDELGISLDAVKLRTWSKQGLISPYKMRYQHRKKKVGRPPDAVKAQKGGRILEKARLGRIIEWPEKALEEAAAVWAVREEWRKLHREKGKWLSKDKIDVIKRAASVLEERPFAVYILPPVTGPLSTQHINPDDIIMKFVSKEFDGIELFPGKDNVEKADCVSELVVKWIAAIEKVRMWKVIGKEAYIAKYHPDLGDHKPLEIDFSKIDPWKVQVPCPWQIGKPARVTLLYLSTGKEFFRPPFKSQSLLSDSDRDELILRENFIDTRTFFRVDFTGSRESIKARLKEIERYKRSSSTSAAEQMNLSLYQEWLQYILLITGTRT